MTPTRASLYVSGVSLARQFCDLNNITMPTMRVLATDAWRFGGTCAYYRPTYIAICPEKCARPGSTGQAWSWPGYVIDRTPHGVVQHELGHHVDFLLGKNKGTYWSDYGEAMRRETGEEKLTNYCPNDAEWFAEIFRLFVTNPDLLARLRPRTFARLTRQFRPAHERPWRDVLENAPARTVTQAEKKIAAASRVTP